MRLWLALMVLLGQLSAGSALVAADDAISLGDSLAPGGVMIGKAPSGAHVQIDGRAIRVAEDGGFVFGIGRDAEGQVEVRIDGADGGHVIRHVAITSRAYDIQRIDGLPPRKVEPNKDDQARIEQDWLALRDAKAMDSALTGFGQAPVWPVTGPISGVFGSQRILNGKPKSPHRGLDVAAATGTPINAMLDGEVIVAAEDMYYTGGTVVVDHGHGLKSLYAHLSEIGVKEGQRLERGDVLGKVGATGRVTGPHLHLSLYWFETALDPALLLGPPPAATQ